MAWRFLALFFSFVFYFGCTQKQQTPINTIVVGIENYPNQLDARLETDAITSKINHLIYEGLLKKDEHMNLVPSLATHMSLSNKLVYSFDLRTNVFFHNGQKMTSADIKATYDSIIQKKINSRYFSDFENIAKIETPHDYQIIFTLKKPFLSFPTLLTLGILPKEIALLTEAERQTHPKPHLLFIGTGPFSLVKKDNTSRERIVLKRFDNYHGIKARSEFITFRVIQDATLRALELFKGRLDIVQNNMPFVMVPYLKKQQDLYFLQNSGINFNYMGFQLKNKYLKNKNVRKAIALAIDREKIIKYKLSGLGQPATSLLNPDHWAFTSDLEKFSFDLEKAKALLDDTPFQDPDGNGPQQRFSLTYKTSTQKERIEIAELITHNLRSLGIDIQLKTYEFGTLLQDVRQGDFELVSLSWVGLSDPDIYYHIFHSGKTPPNGSNRGFYQNKDLDILLEKSREEFDLEKRKQLFHEIQKIVYNDFVYAPLWYDDNIVFLRQGVRGYRLRPDASFEALHSTWKETPQSTANSSF